MVKVLANGDIVPDDDPRATGRSNVPAGDATERNRPRQGFVNHADNQEVAAMDGSVSVFDALNQRLIAAGVPTWHVGTYSVTPIVSVGFVLSFLLGGFRGLLFSGVLFLVVKYSKYGARENQSGRNTAVGGNRNNSSQPQPPSGPSGSWPRGGGYRLGHT